MFSMLTVRGASKGLPIRFNRPSLRTLGHTRHRARKAISAQGRSPRPPPSARRSNICSNCGMHTSVPLLLPTRLPVLEPSWTEPEGQNIRNDAYWSWQWDDEEQTLGMDLSFGPIRASPPSSLACRGYKYTFTSTVARTPPNHRPLITTIAANVDISRAQFDGFHDARNSSPYSHDDKCFEGDQDTQWYHGVAGVRDFGTHVAVEEEILKQRRRPSSERAHAVVSSCP
ncbi:hypothetical protein PM082_014557 [Marasmius tenuissimus]|nr:hypothetical protein PM082_014557 [Marasmius tenuissimus]